MATAPRSPAAKRWFVAWTAFSFCALGLAWVNDSFGFGLVSVHWDTASAAGAWALGLLIPVGLVMHQFDGGHFGFRDVHGRDKPTWMTLDNGAVSGLLTVLSIRSAVGVAILSALWSKEPDILGSPFRAPLTRGAVLDSPVWAEPRILCFYAVASALLLSAIATLVALLCYDYSLRFDWDAAQKVKVKLDLRRKAHKLGVLGFYCLMWSLAAVTFLVDPVLSVLASFAVFVATWYYYFFATDTLTSPAVTLKDPTPAGNQVTLEGTVNPKGLRTNAYFEYWITADSKFLTAEQSMEGTNEKPVSRAVTGLEPATTYSCRLRAGIAESETKQFTTT